MWREQATRAARIELGLVSVESVKERVRDAGWESTPERPGRRANPRHPPGVTITACAAIDPVAALRVD